MNKILNMLEKYVKKLFWLPFVLAMIGYWLMIKLPFFTSMYAAAALYFVNPVVEETNFLVLTAELLAVLVTTGLILSFLGNVWEKARRFFINKTRDSVCIYSDSEIGAKLQSEIPNSYLCETADGKKEFDSRDHIFMFSDEKKSLGSYLEHKDKLKGKRVFIELKEMDPFLLRDTKDLDVHFFSTPEIIARTYWKDHSLFTQIITDGKNELHIALMSYNHIGEAIFRYGYLNNIYSLSQSVTYHIWGCSGVQKKFLNSLIMENGDHVIVHHSDWQEDIEQIVGMDRIIITLEEPINVIRELIYRNKDIPIHYFSERKTGYDRITNAPFMQEFGNLDDAITDDNVRCEKLYRQAKLFNYDYSLRYSGEKCPADLDEKMEEAWLELDGFKKGSNAARADHYWIESLLEQRGVPKEQLWEMEHIRWCRFHRVNHWSYAKERNNEKRKHHLLVPYADLPYKEKEKDGIYDSTIKKEIEKLV